MKYTIKLLNQMAKEQGIKYATRMNSKTLCEKLNIPLERNAYLGDEGVKCTLKLLRQMAKEQGVKNTSKMKSKILCEKLNIPFETNTSFNTHIRNKISIPVPILGVDPVLGKKVVEFPSIYKTAKYLDINPRYVYKYIESKKIVEVFGYKVQLVKKPKD